MKEVLILKYKLFNIAESCSFTESIVLNLNHSNLSLKLEFKRIL